MAIWTWKDRKIKKDAYEQKERKDVKGCKREKDMYKVGRGIQRDPWQGCQWEEYLMKL